MASAILQNKCPIEWNEIQQKYHHALKKERKLVLNYYQSEAEAAERIWQQLIGIVKYLVRTEKTASKQQIIEKLDISDRSFILGLQALQAIGFNYRQTKQNYQFTFSDNKIINEAQTAINNFLFTVAEEQFQKLYFTRVPLSVITNHIEN